LTTCHTVSAARQSNTFINSKVAAQRFCDAVFHQNRVMSVYVWQILSVVDQETGYRVLTGFDLSLRLLHAAAQN
jgi:hypothetical protein